MPSHDFQLRFQRDALASFLFHRVAVCQPDRDNRCPSEQLQQLKTMKSIALILFTALAAIADDVKFFSPLPMTAWQTNIYRATNSEWVAIVKDAFDKPIRRIGDTVYNFTAVRPAFAAGTDKFILEKKDGEETFGRMIDGKVLQVLKDGVLLAPSPRFTYETETVFVKNAPGLGSIYDGDTISVFGLWRPKYTYTTVLGATKTIRAIDCGTIPDAETIALAMQDLRSSIAKRNDAQKSAAESQRSAVKAELERKAAEGRAKAAKLLEDRKKRENIATNPQPAQPAK